MRFITVDEQSKVPVLVWEEQEGKAPIVVSRHGSLDDVPDVESLDVWKYDVPLTTAVDTPLNPGRYQCVDAQGAPLWEGARIAFNVPDHYINTVSGRGAFRSVSRYGGVMMLTDEPMNVYDRRGFIIEKRREQYRDFGNFQYDGQFRGMRMMAGGIGDPFEHGRERTFVVLDQDPRDVCIPMPKPGTSPAR